MSTIFSPNQSRGLPKDLEIELDGNCYPIRLRRSSNARSISLSADPAKREVRISLPRYASLREALSFAESKTDWLAERFLESPAPVAIENGNKLSFLGKEYRISWSPDFARKPQVVGNEIQVGGPQNRVADRILSWMKDRAREAYKSDLNEFCSIAKTDVPRLSVGDARRRWGSCSARGSIRLNWRLIMAPPVVRRSVVAHEVAHLRHMNHSKDFYDHLDQIFDGDRKEADHWLKKNGNQLHAIGVKPE